MTPPLSRCIYGCLIMMTFFGCVSDQAPVVNQIPKVKVVEVSNSDVPVKKDFVGEVKGLFDIPIRARVDGFLEGRFFNEGTQVTKGKLLYVIDSQPYEAAVASNRSLVAEAKTQLVKAINELNRIKPLAEINAVSKSDLDAAVAEAGASEAAVDAAEANLRLSEINLGYTKISSPITGLIGKTKAKVGEYVGKEPNPVILNVVSRIDTILVQFFITENEYLRIARVYMVEHDNLTSPSPKKEDNLELILSDGTLHKFKGTVNFIDREVDPTTGSMLVQASFPNPNGLVRPGQFAKIRVTLKEEKDAKLIPYRCIKDVQGMKNVYVINDDNTLELRPIVAENLYGDLIMVSSGLEAGEKILIEGLQKIRTGMTVEPELVVFESKAQATSEDGK